MIKFFTKRLNNRKGFTLIELVVVIAILGILAALAVPRLMGSRENANKKAIMANLRTIESAYSVAMAEGAFEGDDAIDEDVAGLKAGNYLASIPAGPVSGLTYDLDGDEGKKIAKVDFGTDGYASQTGEKTLEELITAWGSN